MFDVQGLIFGRWVAATAHLRTQFSKIENTFIFDLTLLLFEQIYVRSFAVDPSTSPTFEDEWHLQQGSSNILYTNRKIWLKLGEIVLNIELGKCLIRHKTIISDQVETPCLIGFHCLKNHRMNIDVNRLHILVSIGEYGRFLLLFSPTTRKASTLGHMLLRELFINMTVANILHLLKSFYKLPNIIFQIPGFLFHSPK